MSKAFDNEHVRLAFYNDMLARFKTLDNWSEDRAMPMSETLKMKIIEALPTFIKFMKDRFILKSEDVSMPTEQFFSWYYTESKDRTSKQKIGRYLKKLEIEPKKIKRGNEQYYIYEIKCDKLLEKYQLFNWMDDVTDKIHTTKKLKTIFNDGYDNGIDTRDQSVNSSKIHENEIKHMKMEMDHLKMQLNYKELSDTLKRLDKNVELFSKLNITKQKPIKKETKKDVFQTLVKKLGNQTIPNKSQQKHQQAFDNLKKNKTDQMKKIASSEFNSLFSDVGDALLSF